MMIGWFGRMLNVETKKAAVARLESALRAYEVAATQVGEAARALHECRAQVGLNVIVAVEAYISQLANSPKEFEKSVGELRIQCEQFAGLVAAFTTEASKVRAVGASVSGAGVGAGVGVAALAPTVAISFVTTFGTASTGTAISALSGAAATNATLAWLGGGAVAAGGGGVAAGNALLALAGPVGWTIAGVALFGSAVYTNMKNEAIAEQATDRALEVQGRIAALDVVREEIGRLLELTRRHATGVTALLDDLQQKAPLDYRVFSPDQVRRLGALINGIRALSELLNRNVAP